MAWNLDVQCCKYYIADSIDWSKMHVQVASSLPHMALSPVQRTSLKAGNKVPGDEATCTYIAT